MREDLELKHRIAIDWPADRAMHLFTPKGEELWVDDWAPTYILPTTGETEQGMFFTTTHGDEKTYWSCLNWEPENGFVKYLRLNPGSRVSFVTVTLTPASDSETIVDVSYQVIPLSDGDDDAKGLPTQAQFSEQIEGWKHLVEALARDVVPVESRDGI